MKCPECQSNKTTKWDKTWRVVEKGPPPVRKRIQRYRCNDCGRIFRGGQK